MADEPVTSPKTPRAGPYDPAAAATPTARPPGRRLVVMFAYALVNWSVGNGLLPILPSIASQLGADRILVGVYLAASYVALALGTVAAGLLADRTGRLKWFMVVSMLAAAPLIALTSRATALWELAALTASVWCLAGMALTLVTIRAGASAGPGERGRVLGFLALAAPLGSIAGGFGVGSLADAVGYPDMWILLAAVVLLCPVLAAGLEDLPGPVRHASVAPRPARMRWTAPFLFLIISATCASFGSFVGALGRSFAMQATFTNEAITSTVAVSGIAALPFTVLVGWMSDRLGRLPFIALCYALGTVGLLIYSSATALAAFWVAASLVAFISYVSTGVGSALVVDLVDRPSLGRGLAYFGATGWIGAILGFGLGSVAFSALDLPSGFLVGAAVAGLAVLLVGAIRASVRRRSPERPPADRVQAGARKE